MPASAATPGSPPVPGGVTVSISRDPALVRTVRLVAAAVARRTGRDEEFVEDVRLAVGEACALLIGVSAPDGDGSDQPVTVAMQMHDGLAVDVSSDVPIAVPHPRGLDFGDTEPWALLRGLIDDFHVHQDGPTTRVSMSWPDSA